MTQEIFPNHKYNAGRLLMKYYNQIVFEYQQLNDVEINALVSKYFPNCDLLKLLINQDGKYIHVKSIECYPNKWILGIALSIYVYPNNNSTEIYFESPADLSDYIDLLIHDVHFKDLALLLVHIKYIQA